MSLEAILSRIVKDSEQKAAAIIEAAEVEKEEFLRENGAKLEEEFEKESEKVRARALESMKRKEFHVRREAAREVMNARRSMMDRALERAVDRLAFSKDGEYLAMITSLLERCDLRGEVQVIISPEDEHRITGDYLKEHSRDDMKFVLAGERHGERGGVIFRSGDISQNGTFPMIAELAHEELVMELSRLVPLEKI